MEDSVKLYRQEQELLKKYQQTDPDLVTPNRNFSYSEILEHIGIKVNLGDLIPGYSNLYHQDFIVEEISRDGGISTIEPGNFNVPLPTPGNRTLYADLVKVGLSSIEAKEILADNLKISPEQVTYAGIKDKMALTSQQIAIRDIGVEKIKNLKAPAMFLKNFSWGKGVMEKGSLWGNQFIILIRAPITLAQSWLDKVLTRVEDGFYNFYYLQRFGSPRLLSHQLGKLLLQGDYQQVVKTFLCDTGVQSVPLIDNLRQAAKNNFGRWPEIKETFSQLPYTFRLELGLVEYLIDHPQDYLGALKTILDQTTLWIYAYASYLFNLHLSALINNDRISELPKTLPLLLNSEALQTKIYQQRLKEDEIYDLEKALKTIFGRSPLHAKNVCLTMSPAKIIKTKIINKGVALAFQLPAGAYATTFLMHLFELYRGLPLPKWLDKTKYDTKEILGLGSVAETEKILREYFFSQVKEGE